MIQINIPVFLSEWAWLYCRAGPCPLTWLEMCSARRPHPEPRIPPCPHMINVNNRLWGKTYLETASHFKQSCPQGGAYTLQTNVKRFIAYEHQTGFLCTSHLDPIDTFWIPFNLMKFFLLTLLYEMTSHKRFIPPTVSKCVCLCV